MAENTQLYFSNQVVVLDAQDIAPPNYVRSQGVLPTYRELQLLEQNHRAPVQRFCEKVSAIFFGTLGCTLCVATVIVVPILMVVLGAKNIERCSVQPFIPIYVIVFGCLILIKVISNVVQMALTHSNSDPSEAKDPEYRPLLMFDTTMNCLLFGWFIAGNVTVYQVPFSAINVTHGPSCDGVLYWTAFWVNTSVYLVILFLCLLMCVASFVHRLTKGNVSTIEQEVANSEMSM